MTAILKIEQKYIAQFEELISQLPKDAVMLSPIKNSLSYEIENRIEHYACGEMKTTPFSEGLDRIRERLVNQL